MIYRVRKKCKNALKNNLIRLITYSKFNNDNKNLFISNALVTNIGIGGYNKSSLIDGLQGLMIYISWILREE